MERPVEKISAPGLEVMTVRRPTYDKHFITAHPTNEDDPYSMFEAVAAFTKSRHAHIVSQFIFGGSDLIGTGVPEAERYNGYRDWPVTWIHGSGESGAKLSGTQALAITGPIDTIWMDGEALGSVIEDEHARYCLLGDVRPRNTEQSRSEQTAETFRRMEEALQQAGMSFLNVVRTWIYLDRILDWYDDFNVVRNGFFEEHDVYRNLVPASTGIGVANPQGAALVTDVMAIQPKDDKLRIQAVPSPLQCPALDYKSSFSRAIEIEMPQYRKLCVSGTASIEPGGKTVHVGDVDKQVQLTMEVIGAILESRRMDWKDTTRAIAYFKDIKDAPVYHRYCSENGIPPLPVALAHADVCRDELLFELELDAVQCS